MKVAYTPAVISCTFYNYLENYTRQQQACSIVYYQNDGSAVKLSSPIVDLFSWQGTDYLLLEKGQLIRLDRLVSVNDTTPPLFS